MVGLGKGVGHGEHLGKDSHYGVAPRVHAVGDVQALHSSFGRADNAHEDSPREPSCSVRVSERHHRRRPRCRVTVALPYESARERTVEYWFLIEVVRDGDEVVHHFDDLLVLLVEAHGKEAMRALHTFRKRLSARGPLALRPAFVGLSPAHGCELGEGPGSGLPNARDNAREDGVFRRLFALSEGRRTKKAFCFRDISRSVDLDVRERRPGFCQRSLLEGRSLYGFNTRLVGTVSGFGAGGLAAEMKKSRFPTSVGSRGALG